MEFCWMGVLVARSMNPKSDLLRPLEPSVQDADIATHAGAHFKRLHGFPCNRFPFGKEMFSVTGLPVDKRRERLAFFKGMNISGDLFHCRLGECQSTDMRGDRDVLFRPERVVFRKRFFAGNVKSCRLDLSCFKRFQEVFLDQMGPSAQIDQIRPLLQAGEETKVKDTCRF